MAIDELRKIDFVVFPKQRNDIVELLIVDHLDWGVGEEEVLDHLFLLQEKVNSYLDYIHGQLTEDFPAAKGRKVVIRVHFANEPPALAKQAMDSLRNALEGIGIRFEYRLGAGE